MDRFANLRSIYPKYSENYERIEKSLCRAQEMIEHLTAGDIQKESIRNETVGLIRLLGKLRLGGRKSNTTPSTKSVS